MAAPHLLNAADLRAACEARLASACRCALRPAAGWESFTEERWPAAQMQALGTLRDPEVLEPTLEEHHPASTRYEAAQAPIAVGFFPYNRSDAFACERCSQVLLRYTEFGGYYVDHRVRAVAAALIVD
jgi:hypothetical protein